MTHTKHDTKQLIAQGRVEEAIEILLKMTKKSKNTFIRELHDTLLVNSSRFHGAIRDENRGNISPEERKRTNDKVTNAILYVVKQLPDEVFAQKTGMKNKHIIIGLATIVVSSLLLVFVYRITQQETNVLADNKVDTNIVSPIDSSANGVNEKTIDTNLTRGVIVDDDDNNKKPVVKPKKLSISIWTNKGNKPEYTEGEEVSIYFKVTRPCYVRLIYIMVDGSAVLLADNHKVSADFVGKTLEAPTKFGVGAPFGNEMLRAYIQTVPFDKLQTQKNGNYDIITQKLGEAYEITERGLYKKVSFKKVELPFVTKRK